MKSRVVCTREFTIVITLLLTFMYLAGSVPAQEAHGSTGTSRYSEIIDSVSNALNEVYVFPRVASDVESYIRKRLADGAYDSLTTLSEFCSVLTDDLQLISQDGHLEMIDSAPNVPDESNEESDEGEVQRALERWQYDNFGFSELKRLPGNVGYLKLDAFYDALVGGNTAVAAMNYLAHCDALIIDLRENSGGFTSMILLISSYFFDDAIHFSSFYVRKEDTTFTWWTQAHVQGLRMNNTLLYVLTSSHCFSAPEAFAYELKNLGRATIVGEKTAGGAHPSRQRFFDNLGIGMWIPFARSISPTTGTDWEGTGVEPDIHTIADSALDVAYISALRKLLETEEDERRRAALNWPLDRLEADQLQYELGQGDSKQYVGTYGPRRIWLKDGVLHYQRGGSNPTTMTPMKKDLFCLDGKDDFRLRFVRNEVGEIVELVGLYEDGRSDSSSREK